MSAFSRGLFFRPQCTFKPPRNLYSFYQAKNPEPRLFSTTVILRAVKKKRPQPTVNPIKPAKPVKPTNYPIARVSPLAKAANDLKRPSYQSYASRLAEKGHPTLIYVAPSHTVFLISSYSAAAFCFSYATYNFWYSSLYAPPGLAAWVPVAFGVVCFGMSAMGTWLMLSPSRLIRTITAVPKAASKIAAGRNGLPKGGPMELELEIVVRKMLPIPFVKPRTLRMKPEDLVIRSPFVRPAAKIPTPAEKHLMMMEEEAEKKRVLEYEQTHIMSSPFRHMNKLIFKLFRAIARAWTREGFAKLKVHGQTYKLDVTGGWALDGGKALDRLVTLKPEI